ncbi:hypothetical protein K1T71_003397 [Dendrolimus kikuchii]|uniref:Uncharacterized protein n=1 Tax=Dendrolimus kikuchii TaxID=765133 RepID=A0ACC1DD02_9NEOP|nr:hypothetical protein K1T71_003397 [Dendrolimus kikuchii]
MADSVNMSLDEIIKKNQQNRASRSRGRGGGTIRGRGGGRGAGRGRGRGGRGRGGLSQSRPGTPGAREGRSRSRGPRGRSQSRTRSGSRSRSRQRRSNSRGRSASRSRSQNRRMTPKGRAGLEFQQADMPQLMRTGGFGRGRFQNRLRGRNISIPGSVHSRLGLTSRRGLASLRRPLAVAKRGISKRGRGFSTNNKYSTVGLRSDQILKEQRHNMLLRNNIIKSQTFTRTRNNSFNSASQLTVSVANDFARRRRNSVGSPGYLNKQSLAQLNNQFGGYNTRRGPGSVKSMGSNKSNRSSHSNRSNSNRSTRSRGRGRGLGHKFINKQMLNVKLQKEIAAIQGKTYGTNANNEAPSGVNFTPTPAATGQTLHQRFATT